MCAAPSEGGNLPGEEPHREVSLQEDSPPDYHSREVSLERVRRFFLEQKKKGWCNASVYQRRVMGATLGYGFFIGAEPGSPLLYSETFRDEVEDILTCYLGSIHSESFSVAKLPCCWARKTGLVFFVGKFITHFTGVVSQ